MAKLNFQVHLKNNETIQFKLLTSWSKMFQILAQCKNFKGKNILHFE